MIAPPLCHRINVIRLKQFFQTCILMVYLHNDYRHLSREVELHSFFYWNPICGLSLELIPTMEWFSPKTFRSQV